MTIRPLETEFIQSGYTMRQLKRDGDVALFEQAKGGHVIAYEIVIVQIRPERTFPDGRVTPCREGYPGNEEWGTNGWTILDEDEAKRRFKALVEERRQAKFTRHMAGPDSLGGSNGSGQPKGAV